MGMGEPLANLDRLLPALAQATSRDGLGISAGGSRSRRSACPRDPPAGRENCQYHLAVSLHAADDELRNELVPANRKIGIAAILAAADDYFAKTGRRVTFEYVLLAGVNDQPSTPQQLVALLRGPAVAGEPDSVQSRGRASVIARPRRRPRTGSRRFCGRRVNVQSAVARATDRRRLRAVAAQPCVTMRRVGLARSSEARPTQIVP